MFKKKLSDRVDCIWLITWLSVLPKEENEPNDPYNTLEINFLVCSQLLVFSLVKCEQSKQKRAKRNRVPACKSEREAREWQFCVRARSVPRDFSQSIFFFNIRCLSLWTIQSGLKNCTGRNWSTNKTVMARIELIWFRRVISKNWLTNWRFIVKQKTLRLRHS